MKINTLEQLVLSLINEIGLVILPNGIVMDDDTGIEIRYEGKSIMASVDPNRPAIPTDMFVIFDPVFDGRLMNTIMGYYLKKSAAMGDFEANSFYEEIETTPFYAKDDNIRTRRSRIAVVINSPQYGRRTIYSNYYYQKGLKFSEVILRLGGYTDVDLSKFDSCPDEVINPNSIITNVYQNKDRM